MKSDNFYRYATVGLAVLNIVVLAFFLLHEPPPRGAQDHFRQRAVDILQLDAAQNEEFNDLATRHRDDMRAIKEKQRAAVKAYFADLTASNAEGKPGGSLEQVKAYEAEKLETTYQHFLDVRGILRPEQKPLFKEFVNRALDMVLLNKRRHGPPPQKRR